MLTYNQISNFVEKIKNLITRKGKTNTLEVGGDLEVDGKVITNAVQTTDIECETMTTTSNCNVGASLNVTEDAIIDGAASVGSLIIGGEPFDPSSGGSSDSYIHNIRLGTRDYWVKVFSTKQEAYTLSEIKSFFPNSMKGIPVHHNGFTQQNNTGVISIDPSGNTDDDPNFKFYETHIWGSSTGQVYIGHSSYGIVTVSSITDTVYKM